MRKLFFIFFFVLFSVQIGAQIEKYFPLKVGDERQYHRHTMMYFEILYEKIVDLYKPDSNSSIYKVEKTSNLNTTVKTYYYKTDKRDPYTLFISQETSNPQNFYPLYKLNVKPGDKWDYSPDSYSWFTFAFYTTSLPTLWGALDSTANYYKTRTFSGAPDYYCLMTVMKGLGLTREYLFEVEVTNLTGCKLNGIKYGDFVDVENENIPIEYDLEIKNFPNPFNGQTTIEFTIPKEGNVEISIFNILGQKIANPINENMISGKHSFSWDANNLSSGLYILMLNYNNLQISKKIILQK